MVEIWLPYGSTETFVSVNDENLLGILRPKSKDAAVNPGVAVDSALQNPSGTEPLDKIVSQGMKPVLLLELSSPGAQNIAAVSHVLERLCEKGIPSGDIRVLLASETGDCIRANKEVSDLWSDMFSKYSIVEHEPTSSECVEIGKTSKGVRILVNKVFAEADSRIVVSDVSLHRFFGLKGGCSSILPGIANVDTIKRNHAMMVNPNVQIGVQQGNPVYEGMQEAAGFAKVDLGVCLIANAKGELVKAYAGNLVESFHAASQEYLDLCTTSFKEKSQIVIASAGGSPYDRDLYHACAWLEGALRVVKDDGAIILVAECPGAYGNKTFYEWTKNFRELKEIQSEIRKKYALGSEVAYQLLKAREKAKIYLVSVMPDYYASSVFKLRTARTTNGALQSAQRVLGKDSKIMVLPYAPMTFPVQEEKPHGDEPQHSYHATSELS